MSIRHLDSLFDPASVALIGATSRADRVGSVAWSNLRLGGFRGRLLAVNPKYRELDGHQVHARIKDLPEAPELAVICTPANTVAALVDALGERGTRAVVVLTSGLTARQRQAMLDAARRHLVRILGPGGVGLLVPHLGLNASLAPADAAPGRLAFVSQSSALVTAMLDWARGSGIGLSRCVSLGEQADIDVGDMLDWLASDARTRAILLYVESITAARKFMSAARAAARNKPVLVVKAGRSAPGQQPVADLVVDAAIRRAGMLRVDSLQDLFISAQALAGRGVSPAAGGSPSKALQQERLTLLGNGSGASVIAADAAVAAGLELAPWSEALRRALDAVLPAGAARGNPLELQFDAPVESYVQTVQALLAEPASGTVLLLHAPNARVRSADIARALLPLAAQQPQRLISCWLGGPGVAMARQQFHQAGVPTFDTPEQAVRACALLATYRRNQDQLMQMPAARTAQVEPDRTRVKGLVSAVLDSGRQLLTLPEALELLQAAGVPVVPSRVAGPSPAEAVAVAQALGFPVVLKILSPQLRHKSEVGGVALQLDDEVDVHQAASAMLARVRRLQPQAQVQGFCVQTMVRWPHARELIVGSLVDPLFGPVILFGAGGTAVEVLADLAVALPPLNAPLAEALIARTRVARLLGGWREVPAAHHAALLQVLTGLSQLLAEEDRIAEIDINPLLADAQGVLALDARVRVSAQAPGGAAHFAIRPYPSEQVESLDWQGAPLVLRPIRPEDGVQHLAFLERLEPADIRMRIFYSRRSIERSELARLTQVDFERELAYIATRANADGSNETLAVVRAVIDPDNADAEFGIVVRSDLKGGGLGALMMNKLIRHLRERGTQRLLATVLAENRRMLDLAQELGFKRLPLPTDDDTVDLALQLR